MARLSVNVDHVATLREARGGKLPDPVAAAILAEMAGADGITIHLRGDRRHIKDRDLYILRNVVHTHLNLEMAATPQVLEKALEVVPDMVTLVPERPGEKTTEGGLDLEANYDLISETIGELQTKEILVSLFINPDIDSVKSSAKLRSDYVELNTTAYTEAETASKESEELERLGQMAELAEKLGLGLNAGHGLNYKNIQRLLEIEQIEEVSIGHALVARAVMVGFYGAVEEMLELVR
ncbi:MAG: pyridoxine 5'-phosphate synthase [Candidatus Zixiibacteriota bacterium]|nr:MAG: pyridoxine 5'-phosphate synthase [candidate division Zixibacteria bacterium]